MFILRSSYYHVLIRTKLEAELIPIILIEFTFFWADELALSTIRWRRPKREWERKKEKENERQTMAMHKATSERELNLFYEILQTSLITTANNEVL